MRRRTPAMSSSRPCWKRPPCVYAAYEMPLCSVRSSWSWGDVKMDWFSGYKQLKVCESMLVCGNGHTFSPLTLYPCTNGSHLNWHQWHWPFLGDKLWFIKPSLISSCPKFFNRLNILSLWHQWNTIRSCDYFVGLLTAMLEGICANLCQSMAGKVWTILKDISTL